MDAVNSALEPGMPEALDNFLGIITSDIKAIEIPLHGEMILSVKIMREFLNSLLIRINLQPKYATKY